MSVLFFSVEDGYEKRITKILNPPVIKHLELALTYGHRQVESIFSNFDF